MSYKDKNKEAEYQKRYRASHKTEIQEYNREYNKVNAEKRQVAVMERRKDPAYREREWEYRKTNRGKTLERQRRHRNAYPEKVRAWRLKHHYDLTPEVFNTLIDGQGFTCAICSAPDFANGKPLHVDHDHKTGWVRGLLCRA